MIARQKGVRLLLAAALALLAAVPSAFAQKPRADRPIYQMGDKWIRNDGAYDLVRIEGDLYVFSAGTGQEVHLTKDLAIARVFRRGALEWSFDPPIALRWPLEVGKWGQTRFFVLHSGRVFYGTTGGLFTTFGPGIEAKWEVEAYEDVRLAGGSVKAFRVGVRMDTLTRLTVGRLAFWYSPELRQIIRLESAEMPSLAFEVVGASLAEKQLEVALDQPRDGARLAVEDVIVSGTVNSGRGVVSVITSLNGTQVAKYDDRRQPRQEVALRVPIKLEPGRNVVTVTATDAAGETRQEARVVFVQRVPADAQDSTSPPRSAMAGKPLVSPAAAVQPAPVQVSPKPAASAAATPAPAGADVSSKPAAPPTAIPPPVVAEVSPEPAPPAAASPPPAPAEMTPKPPMPPAATPTPAAAKMSPNPATPPPAAAPPVVAEVSPEPAPPPAAPPPPAPAKMTPKPPMPPAATPSPAAAEMSPNPATPPPAAALPPTAPVSQKPAASLAALPPPTLVTPPVDVKIAAPAEGLHQEHAEAVLAAVASGGKGVTRVVVTLNGVEVQRLDERPPAPTLPVTLPLRLREGPNTIVVTAIDASGRTHQEVRSVRYDKPTALAVSLSYPPDSARVSQESLVVVASAVSSKGVARLSVTVNGVEAHQQSEARALRSATLTVPVRLQDGTNVIVVRAAEADGTSRQEVRTVIFDRPQPVVAFAPPRPAPDRWAVVIGVGAYDSPDIPRLRYTVPDADAIAQALIKLAGFKKEHVLVLTDRTERKPTLRNIKWALGTFLGRSARKDDTVFIFFAGHGAPETDTRGLERDGLAKYLVPADADPDDLYSTALPMDELLTIFGRIESERVVAFLDACYSGAAGGRTFTSKKTRSGHVDEAFLERLTQAKGRAIITASRPTEVSIELPELGHGIFTYYVLQGLRGAADLNRDGIVSLQELYEYVEQQVSRKARAVGGKQNPVMKGELEGVLPLVKVGTR